MPIFCNNRSSIDVKIIYGFVEAFNLHNIENLIKESEELEMSFLKSLLYNKYVFISTIKRLTLLYFHSHFFINKQI